MYQQSGVDPAAERHFQRGVFAFNQGFGEGFAVASEYGEIRGGIKRNSQ